MPTLRIRLVLLLSLAPAFVGCDDPLEPTDRAEPSETIAALVPNDAHILLGLSFNDNLKSADGESPTRVSGVTFESGISGSGVLIDGTDLLRYRTEGNFTAAAGTLEFWIRPRWNGNDHTDRFFFTIGDVLWVVKDAADNLRFFLGREDSEAHQGYNLGGWTANEWHYIAVTWKVSGRMITYVDGMAIIAHPCAQRDLISSPAFAMTIGSRNGAAQANAVFDDLRISDVQRSEEEIRQRYAAGPTLRELAVQPITAEPFVTWRQPAKLIATTNAGTFEYPASTATWSSSNPAVATVNAAGVIRAVAAGRATISAMRDGVRAGLELRVKSPVLPPKIEPISSFLATPAANNLFEVPVVILRYLPTTDGINLDVVDDLGPISLHALKGRIDTFDIRTKFMLEEGSKFRGYKYPTALPSVGYRVIAYITVYEPTPPGRVRAEVAGYPVYQPDYHQILKRFDAKRYVEELGVKEFWLWTTEFNASSSGFDPRIHKPELVSRGLDESNMSSSLTGDISNSGRDPTDLPIYSKTYVLYGQNFRRTEREAVHNRGHQLEQILEYVNIRQDGNATLFWQKFVGPSDPNAPFRRCGWTHVPPNTTVEYDYHSNYNEVLSDIADWTPAGTGQKALVSAHTWGDHPYTWPTGMAPIFQEDRNEAHWYIYWMQSMPGRVNTIPFGLKRMTNWWRFTGDWDGSIRNGAGLYR